MEEQIDDAIIELVEMGKMVAFWRSGRVVIKERTRCTAQELRTALNRSQWRHWLREENFKVN